MRARGHRRVCQGFLRLLGSFGSFERRRFARGRGHILRLPYGLFGTAMTMALPGFFCRSRVPSAFSTSQAVAGGGPGARVLGQRNVNHGALTLCSVGPWDRGNPCPGHPAAAGRGPAPRGSGRGAGAGGGDSGRWSEVAAGRGGGAEVARISAASPVEPMEALPAGRIGGESVARATSPPCRHPACRLLHRPNATPRPIFATPDAFLRHHASCCASTSLNLCLPASPCIGQHTPARAPARVMRGARTWLVGHRTGPSRSGGGQPPSPSSLADHRNFIKKTKAALHVDPHLAPPAEPVKA